MDGIDRAILRELQADGRMSIVDLAARVNLTKTPCSERVRKLEQAGVIRGYRAELDPAALEAAHIVLVQVQLRGTTARELQEFSDAVRRVPEIQTCYLTAGNADYLLKVRSRGIEDYRRLLGEKISRLPHLLQTHSFVVMESVKDDLTLPVPGP